mmetsp:Transcript_60632/g.161898  ORF Transcript_60632/g.161898 Transcript_60632/m.161898 type:complete len:225 (-) Transcript_60632:30-704(-)
MGQHELGFNFEFHGEHQRLRVFPEIIGLYDSFARWREQFANSEPSTLSRLAQAAATNNKTHCVVQVIMDGDGANRAAWPMIEAEYPHIVCSWCAAHVLDLLLADIGKLDIFLAGETPWKQLELGVMSTAHWYAAYIDLWWPELGKVGMRVLAQVVSASACERNWSAYGRVHTDGQNRLNTMRMLQERSNPFPDDVRLSIYNWEDSEEVESEEEEPIDLVAVDDE